MKNITAAARELSAACNALSFGEPVTHVYNPLDYAWGAHEQYLNLAATGKKKVVFLGMNPGPFGMAQTGVPFGEIAAVRDWIGIDALISKPDNEHPKRPVEGLAGLIDDALDVVQRAPLCADVPGDVLKTALDASDINAGVRRTRCF